MLLYFRKFQNIGQTIQFNDNDTMFLKELILTTHETKDNKKI